MIFSISKLANTLINIITGSPTSILFIVLGIIFSIAMIVNIKKNKTIGKTLFITGWIFIISFILIKYNDYLSKIFDNLINNVFMQIFFPNIATYLIVIILTNIIFLFTILNKNSKTNEKIINSIFFTIIMVLMIITIEQISKNNINIYIKEEVYTNQNILTLIESTTLIFGFWQLIILSKYIIKKLINKSNEKIKKEFEEKENNEENDKEKQIEEPIPTITPTMISTTETPIIEPTVIPIQTTIPTIEPTVIPVQTTVPTKEPTVIPVQTATPTIEPTIVIDPTIKEQPINENPSSIFFTNPNQNKITNDKNETEIETLKL